MSVLLQAKNISLDVPAFVQRQRESGTWMSTLLAAATAGMRRENRRLLSDIDFTLEDGDRLALLGGNGAGKTTLLRVLAGSLSPTNGELVVNGSRQALLNLSLGFSPEATVKENIFLRATAMGMRAASARSLVGPILEFAELENVANHRLATLSSGQRMRLGFAVSTSVQHDIMLLDEWFGAGDSSFVRRARERMSDRVSGSRIVVLASHSSNMLRKVCNRGLVMDHGRIVYLGTVDGAVDAYKAIYQSSEEYQAGRKQIEEEANRQIRIKLLELERERKNALRLEVESLRRERQSELAALQEQKRLLRQERDKLSAFRAQLMAKTVAKNVDISDFSPSSLDFSGSAD